MKTICLHWVGKSCFIHVLENSIAIVSFYYLKKDSNPNKIGDATLRTPWVTF
jgi:hypothetical protein